jgi:hypothetical protein
MLKMSVKLESKKKYGSFRLQEKPQSDRNVSLKFLINSMYICLKKPVSWMIKAKFVEDPPTTTTSADFPHS